MSRPALRLEELEPKPKQVLKVPTYVDRLGLSKMDPIYSRDLFVLIRCIENGTPLPPGRFYRSGKGRDRDEALMQHGVMHLHLGAVTSDVLLFLMQFADYVALLEINNHAPFRTRPPGVHLQSSHAGSVKVLQAQFEARAAQQVADKKAAVLRGLLGRRIKP